MAWGGAGSPGGGADSSPDAPGGGLGAGAFGPDGPSVSGQSESSKDTSTIEGFREAIARAMGVTAVTEQEAVSKEQTEAELDAIANARARSAAVANAQATKAAAIAQAQKERAKQEQEMDAAYQAGIIGQGTAQVSLDEHDAKFGIETEDVTEDETYGPTFSGMTSPFGIDESQFDDPSNTNDVSPDSNPVGPTRSFQEQAMNEAVAIGAQRTNVDPSDTGNISRQKQEQEIDKSYYDSRTIDRQKQANMKAIQDRFGFSPGNPHMDVNLDSPSREALAKDHRMRDPVFRDLAFNFIDNVMDEGPKNTALESLVGYINKAFNPAFGLGTIAKAILDSFGFNVNPNLGQRALAAATTAYEGGIPGNRGAGGLMEGERNDSFGEEQAIKLLEKLEPWTKGLNKKQIDYYFDRPSELEWVRNLWNQMNPKKMESEWIY
jgi:hypothetical protein